jgi:hypothetical protein
MSALTFRSWRQWARSESQRTAAAQEPDSQEIWHPHLTDCFQVFGTAGERLFPSKLKVNHPLFGGIHAVPVNVGYGS